MGSEERPGSTEGPGSTERPGSSQRDATGEVDEHAAGHEVDDGGIEGEESASSHTGPVPGAVPAPNPAPGLDDPQPHVRLEEADHLVPGEDPGEDPDVHPAARPGHASAGPQGGLPQGGPLEQGEPEPTHDVPGLRQPDTGSRQRP
ncbi:MAG TPA: hypothetical protein VES95_05520 [Dermatophilaceae bacterium]|nr:hypothetical protein [Dermatophilaceae bacterium]